MASQNEIRQRITNQIVAALKSGGVPPWRRPWQMGANAGSPTNVVSKKRYRGINPILLEAAAMSHGFESKWWATFNQWKKLGGRVRRRPDDVLPGQWGTQIVYWSPVVKVDTDDEGEEIEDKFFVMKTYSLFCIDQVDGPFDDLRVGSLDTDSLPVADADFRQAEEAIAATKATIRHGGERAFYAFDGDYIQMPHRVTFSALNEYFEVLLHEVCHWTEHLTRLNWSRAESENSYAMGELIAEIGGCFLTRELGLPHTDNLSNHVAYLQSWLRGMEGDPRFIFTASTQASKAVDYVLAFSQPPEPDAVPDPKGVLVG